MQPCTRSARPPSFRPECDRCISAAPGSPTSAQGVKVRMSRAPSNLQLPRPNLVSVSLIERKPRIGATWRWRNSHETIELTDIAVPTVPSIERDVRRFARRIVAGANLPRPKVRRVSARTKPIAVIVSRARPRHSACQFRRAGSGDPQTPIRRPG